MTTTPGEARAMDPTLRDRVIANLLGQIDQLKASGDRVKAAVFDADGTLVDSLPPHVGFCHEMNSKFDCGLTLPDTKDLIACRSLSAVGSVLVEH